MRSARSQPQDDDLLLPDARTVRVLVMGDQGVGKSELQTTDSEPVQLARPTVSFRVKAHGRGPPQGC
ncbi:hypothetical protein DIPPA_27859 [Diplonema papillatum]|nr:hypothetical protein DIPPA_27859 [Diplonema papillatum]